MNRRKKRSGYTCSSSYPWAFNNGETCCGYDQDYYGTPISLTSTSCLGNAYVHYTDCLAYGCTNYPGDQLSY